MTVKELESILAELPGDLRVVIELDGCEDQKPICCRPKTVMVKTETELNIGCGVGIPSEKVVTIII